MSKENVSMIAFRKAGSGFNREDVYKYIEDMNIRFKTEKEALNKECSRLSKEVDRLLEQNGSETEKKEQVADNRADALLEKIKKAEEENLLLQTENSSLKAQLDELKSKIDSSSNKEAAETADPIASVKARADQIVSDAEVAARLLTERASSHVSEMADECEKMTVSYALDSLKELEEAFLSARVKIKEIQYTIEDGLKDSLNKETK